ncbi:MULTISPECIES: XRE family transcriptional regulator [unclassified Novosphingobium]|uniref:XRE family transcriptional regulator n=1 Tax=unclassified Novosphingobium TaxID=2644732 RepID=UPI001358E202|nr:MULTISPECIES: XRE family transcriptional regulator [unclassified Novosphingobium]
MENRLAHIRKKAGYSQQKLGELLNSGRSTVTKLERGEIPMSDRWLDRLTQILNCSPSDILGEQVPVVGRIGAGGTVVFDDLGFDEMVPRPPETPGELIGLEVHGESMLPKFDPGDIIYISRDHDGVEPQDIGAICACRLTTGETYLKQLLKGSGHGLFTLRSYNAADMEDCELVWATPIRAITPKHARRYN